MTTPRSDGPAHRSDGTAARAWARDLAEWALPQHILESAPASPWIQPVIAFSVDGEVADSPSHRRAREGLPDGGSVLDVGCGGGRAAFALVPPAGRVTGVDRQPDMLAAFAEQAALRGVEHAEVLGDWPAVAPLLPEAGHDVVVCQHVAYNVADLAGFALALHRAATRRVVIELGQRHPLTAMSPLWRHFWGLTRPIGPTSNDALAVLREVGLPARLEIWRESAAHLGRPAVSREQQVAFARVRLCLPPERDDEIAAVLDDLGPPAPRDVATLWWDW